MMLVLCWAVVTDCDAKLNQHDFNILINPLSPHDALPHHFTSLRTETYFSYNKEFLNENFHETLLPIHGNFI